MTESKSALADMEPSEGSPKSQDAKAERKPRAAAVAFRSPLWSSSEAIDRFVSDYLKQYALYSEFTAELQDLTEKLLWSSGIKHTTVTARTKSDSSLRSKLSRSDTSYVSLQDITDLTGIRVTTLFPDEVDRVARLVRKEFLIDPERSIDKRKLLDTNAFGYLSVHYIVQLSLQRRRQTEYRRFAHLKAEIQIRSLLQHAWAEVEHDLGYRSDFVTPDAVHRRFARLAGLLELADGEFSAIRDEIESLRAQATTIERLPGPRVKLDQFTILAFIRTSPEFATLRRRLAMIHGRRCAKSKRVSPWIVTSLRAAGYRRVGDLAAGLSEFGNDAVAFQSANYGSSPPKRPETGDLVLARVADLTALASARSLRTFVRYVQDGYMTTPARAATVVAIRFILSIQKAVEGAAERYPLLAIPSTWNAIIEEMEHTGVGSPKEQRGPAAPAGDKPTAPIPLNQPEKTQG